tara:strand:+ start:855 stop:1073 length:219 start_codon:yes stop_codon:yes gene_type:complete
MRWLEIEGRYGKEMKDILPQAFALLGGRVEVAEELMVSPETLDMWIRVCGLVPKVKRETVLVPLAKADLAGN